MHNAPKPQFEQALLDYMRATTRILEILSEDAEAKIEFPPAIESTTPPSARSNIDWPRLPPLGSSDGRRDIAPVISSKQRQPHTVRVYVAGCAGLKSLSHSLRLPLYKIGTTEIDLLQRQKALNADGYAATRLIEGKPLIEPGFEQWSFMTLDFNLPRAAKSPVWVEPRALRVHLPDEISPTGFEKLLRSELAGISLASWLKTEDGRAHMTALGADVTSAERYTSYGFGHQIRISRADELYIFPRREEMPRLCGVIENIVFSHVESQTPAE
jgi:hypothetical protein